MTEEKNSTTLLPIIYILLRGGEVHYGQQKNTKESKISLSKISEDDFSDLINSRIQRNTYSGIIRFISLLLPMILFLCVFALRGSVELSVIISLLITCIVGLLISSIIGRIEHNARITQLNYKQDDLAKNMFTLLQNSLNEISASEGLWSVSSETLSLDWKRQAGATNIVQRRIISFTKGNLPFLRTNVDVWCIIYNARTKIFFLPDLIYIWFSGKYLLFKYEDCEVDTETSQYVEDGYVPKDAIQIDSTWRYVRVDGGPDRRFKNNRQLPIMNYLSIYISFSNKIKVNLKVSNIPNGINFAQTLTKYRISQKHS